MFESAWHTIGFRSYLSSVKILRCQLSLQKPVSSLRSDVSPEGREEKTAKTAKTMTDYILDGSALTTSALSIAHLTSSTRNTVFRHLQVAGSVMAEGSGLLVGCMMKNFCAEAVKCSLKPLMFIIKTRYDETPTRVRVLNASAASASGSVETGLGLGHLILPAGGVAGSLQRYVQTQGAAYGQSEVGKLEVEPASHAKILQTQLDVGMLFQSPGSASSSSSSDKSKFYWVATSVPCSLQALNRTTGECTLSALLETLETIPNLKETGDLFEHKLRAVCTDRYGANFRAEDGLQQAQHFGQYVRNHLPCDCHRAATSLKASIGTLEATVSGVLNTGLVMASECAAVQKLRGLVTDVLLRDMDIYKAAPPMDVALQAHRNNIYEMFLPTVNVPPGVCKANRKRRYILSSFLNGDITKRHICHFCVEGCCKDETETRACVALHVSWALVPRKCPVLSRKGWFNQIEPVDWVSILESHHQLYQRILLSYVGAPQAAVVAAEQPSDSAEVLLSLLPADEPGGGWDEALQQALAADGQSRSRDNPGAQGTAAADGKGEQDRAGEGCFILL